MEQLLLLDQSVFFFINHLPHTQITDSIAMFLSGIGQWGLVWLVIALYLFFREEKKDRWFFLPFLLSVGLVWALSEIFIKSVVLRARPAMEMGAIVVAATGNYSFPSTHTTLAFALAYVLSKEESKWTVWLYVLATCIGLSRIYLGVHYPIDVVGGAVLGWFIGKIAVAMSPREKIRHR